MCFFFLLCFCSNAFAKTAHLHETCITTTTNSRRTQTEHVKNTNWFTIDNIINIKVDAFLNEREREKKNVRFFIHSKKEKKNATFFVSVCFSSIFSSPLSLLMNAWPYSLNRVCLEGELRRRRRKNYARMILAKKSIELHRFELCSKNFFIWNDITERKSPNFYASVETNPLCPF